MAAPVEGLTHQQNRTAIPWRLMAQKLDRESKAVEDRSAVVAPAQVVDRSGRLAEVLVMLAPAAGSEVDDGLDSIFDPRRESLNERRVAVESDHRDLARHAADDRIQHGGQRTEAVEFA